jgi:hypothetical protein
MMGNDMSKLGITVRQAAVLESGFELFDGAAMKSFRPREA